MRILIFTLIFTSAFASQAQTLTPLAFFARCYGHLTGQPLPLNHALRAPLIAGTLSGQQACEDLIDSATIDSTSHQVTNAEGKLVLNRLYEFHRSWVTNGVFEQMEAYLPTPGTYNILDSTETALAITYNGFYSGARYENVLKGDKGYVALRTTDPAITARYYSTGHSMPIRRIKPGQEASAPYVPFKIPGTWSGTDYATSEVLLLPAIQIGNLTGIKLQDQVVNVANYWPGFSRFIGNPSKTETATGTPGMAVNFDFFKNQGGGVLGLNTNILINYGHPIGQLSDGSLKLPRRWIKETLHTLLCTELPALRESDVQAYIDSSTADDVAPWRSSAACLQCHTTMDPLASTARNLTISQTDYSTRTVVNSSTNKIAYSSYMLGKFTVNDNSGFTWSSTPVANFHRMKPTGKVIMRTFSGRMINSTVNNMEEAGSILSQSEDLYQCATKRYFELLTGISVPLYDRGDPRFAQTTAALSTAALKNRLFIENVAKRFKESQSLRSMIKEIINSNYYRDANYLAGGTK